MRRNATSHPQRQTTKATTVGFPIVRFKPPRLSFVFTSLIVALLGCPATSIGQTKFVRCDACHTAQASQLHLSIHSKAVRCQECHGGDDDYAVGVNEIAAFGLASSQPVGLPTKRPPSYDHGAKFRGKPQRSQVPELCGTCHANVQKMNPYGLRTDQLASYLVSGHGKRLKEKGDDRVAVCIDCHGAHDVLKHDNPVSRTFFKNIPNTCGHCHGNAELMKAYDIPSEIVDQYRRSVHGRNVLEKGDAGSPQCATCHGNHAAAPPGFQEVSHVCGQCHKQVEEYFLTSIHGRLPVMARCIGCHAKSGQRMNHEILEASVPADKLREAYTRLAAASSKDLESRFKEEAVKLGGATQLGDVCRYCHSGARKDPHVQLFAESDKLATGIGDDLRKELLDSQWAYAQAISRVTEVGRGVLLVQDEAVRAEDAKTEVVALYAFIHTLDQTEIKKRSQKIRDIAREVNDSLDAKQGGLTLRQGSLWAIWPFVAVFSVLMYRKYLELRKEYVHSPDEVVPAGACPLVTRRRWFDVVLGAMGASAIAGLVWPAIAYMLPVRKRGGGSDRTSAGKESEFAVWEAKKISVRGKPVVILRTDKQFQAYSAICTHLGCIVHWNSVTRSLDCPCHAAVFDMNGKVVSGPPPKPLPEYAVSVAQGEVIIKGLKDS